MILQFDLSTLLNIWFIIFYMAIAVAVILVFYFINQLNKDTIAHIVRKTSTNDYQIIKTLKLNSNQEKFKWRDKLYVIDVKASNLTNKHKLVLFYEINNSNPITFSLKDSIKARDSDLANFIVGKEALKQLVYAVSKVSLFSAENLVLMAMGVALGIALGYIFGNYYPFVHPTPASATVTTSTTTTSTTSLQTIK